MGGVRKKTRHCSKWGHKAEFIQVSYFPYTDRGKAKGRKSRYQESTPKQKRLNDKRSRRYFEALVRSNFGEGDICITPTYDDEHRPADEQEAAKKLSNYISRINCNISTCTYCHTYISTGKSRSVINTITNHYHLSL